MSSEARLYVACACRATKLSPAKLQNPSFNQLDLVAGLHALSL